MMAKETMVFDNPAYWHFIAYDSYKRNKSAESKLKEISKLLDYYSSIKADKTTAYLIADARKILGGAYH